MELLHACSLEQRSHFIIIIIIDNSHTKKLVRSYLKKDVSKLLYFFAMKIIWRCGGSVVVHQTSKEVPGSNPASPTMILMRCRIIVK